MRTRHLPGFLVSGGIYFVAGLLLAWGFHHIQKTVNKPEPPLGAMNSAPSSMLARPKDFGAVPPADFRVSLAAAKNLDSMKSMEIVPCLQEFLLLPPEMRKQWLEGEDWKNEELLTLLKAFYSIGYYGTALDKTSLDQLFVRAAQSPEEAADLLRHLIRTGTKGKLLASRFFRSNQKHPEVNAVVLHEPDLLALSTASFTWIDQYGGTFGNNPEKLQKFVNGLSSELHKTVALEAGLSRNLKHYLKSPDFLLGTIQGLPGRLKILQRWHTENPGSTEAERNALMDYFDGDAEKTKAAEIFKDPGDKSASP